MMNIDINEIVRAAKTDHPPSKSDLKILWSLIDLTSLNSDDTEATITEFCSKVRAFDHEKYGLHPLPAVCVYPQFAGTAREILTGHPAEVAAVSAAFPTGQTFLEIKINEVIKTLNAGATEIDIVINRGFALNGRFADLANEIKAFKELCGSKKLKVILETGEFSDLKLLKRTCDVALEAGADFLKTSTGKISEGATLEKGAVLCAAVKDFYAVTGEKRGVKFSGGIRDTRAAAEYLNLVRAIPGEEWVTGEYMRIGASSLAAKLLNEIPEVEKHPW